MSEQYQGMIKINYNTPTTPGYKCDPVNWRKSFQVSATFITEKLMYFKVVLITSVSQDLRWIWFTLLCPVYNIKAEVIFTS